MAYTRNDIATGRRMIPYNWLNKSPSEKEVIAIDAPARSTDVCNHARKVLSFEKNTFGSTLIAALFDLIDWEGDLIRLFLLPKSFAKNPWFLDASRFDEEWWLWNVILIEGLVMQVKLVYMLNWNNGKSFPFVWGDANEIAQNLPKQAYLQTLLQ